MTFLLAAAVTPTSAGGEGEPRRAGEGVREAGLDLGGSAHTTILKAGAAGAAPQARRIALPPEGCLSRAARPDQPFRHWI